MNRITSIYGPSVKADLSDSTKMIYSIANEVHDTILSCMETKLLIASITLVTNRL